VPGSSPAATQQRVAAAKESASESHDVTVRKYLRVFTQPHSWQAPLRRLLRTRLGLKQRPIRRLQISGVAGAEKKSILDRVLQVRQRTTCQAL